MTQTQSDARACPPRKRVDIVGPADTGSSEESCGADSRSDAPRKRTDTIGSLDTGISTLAEESCSTDSDGAAAPRTMNLGPTLGVVALGSEMLPTKGSACHYEHRCRPCAFYWKDTGCSQGVACEFCHLCGCDEKKRRQKKLNAIRRTEKDIKQKRRNLADPLEVDFARLVSAPIYLEKGHPQEDFARLVSAPIYYARGHQQNDFARLVSAPVYYEQGDFARLVTDEFQYEKGDQQDDFARLVSAPIYDETEEHQKGDVARVLSDQFEDAPSHLPLPDAATSAACSPPPGLEASPVVQEVVIDYAARLRRFTM